MAVDLSAEVKNRKIADSLTNGGDDSDPESDPSTDETDSTDTEAAAEPTPSTAPAQAAPTPSRAEAGLVSLGDYSAQPAASPTPTPSAADRIGPFTHAIAEDQPAPDYVPAPTAVAQPAQPVAAPAQPEAVPAGHIDLGPPGRNIYTDPDTGGRYVVDPASGQMVPYAELATAADKAAQPPEGVVLPRREVTGVGWSPEEGLPVPQDQVRRAQLVKLPATVPPAPDTLTQVERGQLVKLPTQPAPDTLSQVEKGIALPPKVQPAGPVTGAQQLPAGPLTPAKPEQLPAGPLTPAKPQQLPNAPVQGASPRQAAGLVSFGDYSATKPPAAGQPSAAVAKPAAPGQVPAEPAIDIQSQSYTKGRTQEPTKLILHSTDGASEQADINTLTGAEPGHRVSVNYYVTKDGTVHHFVSENDTAWHAGADRYGGNGNAYTLGIEQQHVDGKEPWPDAQVRATAGVAAGILARHPNMTIDDVIGHSDLAGERKQDPVDYPWAKFRQYVAEAQGQQGTAAQAAAPSAQPVTKQKTGFYQGEDPKSFLNGRVTTFATPDDIATGQDNGVGSQHLGTLDTTQVAGVALPQWVLQQMFPGKDWAAAARQARVDVVDPTTGKRLRVPIVDVGPGPGPENAGVVADMTPALKDYFGGDKNLSIKIVPKAGPDVMKNSQLFYDEQAAIKNGFDSSTLDPKRQVIAPAGSRFASVAQTPEEAAAAQQKVQQAIQTQKDLLTKLPEAQGDNPNLIGYYKRLDDPVDGVTAPMRQAMQANLKPQIIAAMRDKFPDIKSDAEAWTRAQSDVGPLEVGAEAWSQVLGGFQQYTSVLQKGVAGTDQLHVHQFLDSAIPGANDQQKNDYLAKLYAMPIDQRIAEVQSHLPQPQTGIPSTDPQQIISALDRLHNTDYQKQQASDLATAAADMKRNLTTDPRLVRTGVGKIVDNVAQIPAFVAAYSNPVMLPLVLAQTNDMARTQLRADHPDWDEKTIGENAARATAVMFLGQEAGAKLMGAGGGALLSSLEGGGKRAIAQALVGLGGGTAIGAGTQAGVNIATGQPIWRGVGEAATSSGIQGLATGLVHGAGELARPGERPAVVEPPPVQPPRAEVPRAEVPPPRPVTAAAVTGPEVSEVHPWYKPPPIVTRGEERTTFTPAELAEQAQGLQGRTPEELQAAAQQLAPPMDFGQRSVWLNSDEAQQAEIDRAQAAQAQQNFTVTQEDVARRAYEISQEREATGVPEDHLSAWTQAQKELSQTKEPILPAAMGEAEPINSAIANRYVQERMAAGELGQIDPSEGQSTEDMVLQGLQMSRTQRDGLIDNFMKAKGGDLDQQGAAIRSMEALLSERSRAASRTADADPTNPQLQAQAKAASDAVTAFHNGPIKKLKQVWSDAGRGMMREIPLDYTTFNGMKEAYVKGRGNGAEAPPEFEPKLKQMADAVSKTADTERVAMNNMGKQIENQTRGKTLPTDDQIRSRLMEIMKDLPCPS